MKTPDVRLDIFEGPLDLLLYLIRKNDLNIYDIPVAQITSEYLSYIEMMKDLNLDLAGEFLVMASTLLEIKARTLLPAPAAEGEDGPDPRAELVNRLLEYQRYKEAAQELHHRFEAHKEMFYRGAPVFSEDDFSLDASLFELLDAFRDVLDHVQPDMQEILYEEIPLEVKIRDLLSYMEGRPYVTFREILQLETTRRGLIVTFLAILELIRLKQVAARQVQTFGEIRVYKVREGAEVPPVIEEMTAAAHLRPAEEPPPPEPGSTEPAPAGSEPAATAASEPPKEE
jgi:segregation and condensation protein A